MASNFIPHICGHNKIYLPERGCSDCEKLEMRVKALEDLVAKTITISQMDRTGASITAEVLGEVIS